MFNFAFIFDIFYFVSLPINYYFYFFQPHLRKKIVQDKSCSLMAKMIVDTMTLIKTKRPVCQYKVN